MVHNILAINTGSTSTKIGYFIDKDEQWSENIEHSSDDISTNEGIEKQLLMRKKYILELLAKKEVNPENLSAIVGRGGLLPPVKAGGYGVNEAMKSYLKNSERGFHASNLAALLADEIGAPFGIPCYIYDAVTADEMCELAHITGLANVYRYSECHVLNSKAQCRKYAESVGKKYEDMNFLVAHLGGGVSGSAHQKGKIIDSIADDAGPFSPERSGSVPTRSIIEMCFSGDYTKPEMLKMQRGKGGLIDLTGESDCRKIEKRIAEGDAKAKLAYEAFAFQIGKALGLLSAVLMGEVDVIILTGGIAYSEMLTKEISKYVSFIAPVVVLAGEKELESLAFGALRILKGEENAHEFVN